MCAGALHTCRQLLIRPSAFFDERDPVSTLPIAASLVVLLAIALGISTVLLGTMLAGSIDATVTVDNPDRPPEWVCDRHGNDSDSHLGRGCDEPETVERDVGPIVYDMMTDYLGFAVVAPFLLWFLGGIVLFVTARLANGTPLDQRGVCTGGLGGTPGVRPTGRRTGGDSVRALGRHDHRPRASGRARAGGVRADRSTPHIRNHPHRVLAVVPPHRWYGSRRRHRVADRRTRRRRPTGDMAPRFPVLTSSIDLLWESSSSAQRCLSDHSPIFRSTVFSYCTRLPTPAE